MERLDLDIAREEVKVQSMARRTGGESAFLTQGDILSISELLYGMLVQGGNDCAMQLALYFGGLLLSKELVHVEMVKIVDEVTRKTQKIIVDPFIHKESYYRKSKEVLAFLSYMNREAKKLNLKNTFFDCPHGLHGDKTKSTAYDLAILSAHCVQDKRFLEITKTKFYTIPKSQRIAHRYDWMNTHQMVSDPHFTPLKYGNSPLTGPCLATCYHIDKPQNKFMILVMLRSKDVTSQWKNAKKLIKWAC